MLINNLIKLRKIYFKAFQESETLEEHNFYYDLFCNINYEITIFCLNFGFNFKDIVEFYENNNNLLLQSNTSKNILINLNYFGVLPHNLIRVKHQNVGFVKFLTSQGSKEVLSF